MFKARRSSGFLFLVYTLSDLFLGVRKRRGTRGLDKVWRIGLKDWTRIGRLRVARRVRKTGQSTTRRFFRSCTYHHYFVISISLCARGARLLFNAYYRLSHVSQHLPMETRKDGKPLEASCIASTGSVAPGRSECQRRQVIIRPGIPTRQPIRICSTLN